MLFRALLLLFVLNNIISGQTLNAAEVENSNQISYQTMDELKTSWAVKGNVTSDKGIYSVNGKAGGFVYHHLLNDYSISFDVKISNDAELEMWFDLDDPRITKKTGVPGKKRIQTFRITNAGLIGFSKDKSKKNKDDGIIKPEWYHIVLKRSGDQNTFILNGKVVSSSSVPDKKLKQLRFRLRNRNGKVQIKNLKLTESDFTSLFNGKDISGWSGEGKPAELCWKVKNGILIGLKSKGPYLRSDKEYADYSFRLEYKVEAGANSGVFIRVPKNGHHHRKLVKEASAGYEIQILDDTAEKHQKLREYQFGASLYDVMGVNKLVGKPVGEWNSLEIICNGGRIVTVHNGIKVVDANIDQYPLMILRRKSGFIGLQNHGGGVAFRNMRIGPPVLIP